MVSLGCQRATQWEALYTDRQVPESPMYITHVIMNPRVCELPLRVEVQLGSTNKWQL